MTEPAALEPKLRNRLLRYLHTGHELPKYYPGCWMSHKYYELDKCSVLNEALSSTDTNVEVVNIILKAYKDGWYTRFETIAFALTKCIRLGSDAVKEASYKAAVQICNTSEELMIFNMFTRRLKTGNGRGWCKAVQEWYLRKDAMELAKEMTRVRSRHGRSHKTLLRKSHVKIPTEDQARDAVVKCTIFGVKRAKQLMGESEATKGVFEFIQKVEDLRHCEDPLAAATMVAQHHFTLEHVPSHLLISQEVWNAVLPQFTLQEVLSGIQRLHNMGYLTNESETTAIVLSMLNNKDIIKKSKVTPLEVYITLCNYKKKTKPLKYEKNKAALEKEQRRRTRQTFNSKTGLWEWTTTRRHPREAKNWGIELPCNPAVVTALSKLIDQTWLLTAPTKLRYMITLDMRHHMFKGRHFCNSFAVPKSSKKVKKEATPGAATAAAAPANGAGDANAEKKSKKRLYAECFYNKHVTPGHAAIILAMQILKREKNVKLAVFSDTGVQIVAIERNFSNIDEAEFQLRKANLGCVQLDAPMEWAARNKHKVDVFINMVDRTSRYMELEPKDRGGRGPGARFGPPPKVEGVADHCPVRALQRYRDTIGVKDAKLIVMSLASHRVSTTDGSHEGVLDVVGIDEHVPKLLDAFARGYFK